MVDVHKTFRVTLGPEVFPKLRDDRFAPGNLSLESFATHSTDLTFDALDQAVGLPRCLLGENGQGVVLLKESERFAAKLVDVDHVGP